MGPSGLRILDAAPHSCGAQDRRFGPGSEFVLGQIAVTTAPDEMEVCTMKNNEVDQWFAGYDNPQKDVLLYVREVILSCDSRIEECIKWQSPTFTYKGNIASFNPR